MTTLVAYKRMPVWDRKTVPTEIIHKHNTKVGTWGKITVLQGRLQYEAIADDHRITDVFIFDKTSDIPMVEPQAWHRVTLLDEDTAFFVEFFCREEDYFAKKYQLGRAHSEVVEAMQVLPAPGRVLDLGCGHGRNSLYLAKKGFAISAVDQNLAGLERLQEIAVAENLEIQTERYDIGTAAIHGLYDFIVSTVVLMFLSRERIPAILQNMQESTVPGGYNLIVCAMDTEDAPCPLDFPFTFAAGELKEYYKGWEFIKYNEDFGHLHKLDEKGNRIRLRFATMLARKPF